jgi:hypothetical protein
MVRPLMNHGCNEANSVYCVIASMVSLRLWRQVLLTLQILTRRSAGGRTKIFVQPIEHNLNDFFAWSDVSAFEHEMHLILRWRDQSSEHRFLRGFNRKNMIKASVNHEHGHMICGAKLISSVSGDLGVKGNPPCSRIIKLIRGSTAPMMDPTLPPQLEPKYAILWISTSLRVSR